MSKLAFILFLFFTHFALGQIDTLAFTLDKKLLVFKGKINGQVIDFAFDTGASVGVANSANVALAKIDVLKSSKKVIDANQSSQKISYVKIEELQIGSHQFKNIKDVQVDMNFLACNNLYLLGQNVIKKLNWKIDFQKMLLYISKIPFEAEVQTITWPIKKYLGNRPMVECKVGDESFEILIDFGFAGVFDVNKKHKSISDQFEIKKALGKGSEHMTANMGLFGLGTPSLYQTCQIDSIYVCETMMPSLHASIIEDTDTKLGVGFFSSYCKSIIFNFSQDKLYLTPSGKSINIVKPFDVKVNFEEGIFKVYSKNLDPSSSGARFEIGEQIMSVDGKKVADFKSECDYFNWYFFKKEATVKLEKLTGEIIEVKRDAQ